MADRAFKESVGLCVSIAATDIGRLFRTQEGEDDFPCPVRR